MEAVFLFPLPQFVLSIKKQCVIDYKLEYRDMVSQGYKYDSLMNW